MSSAAPIPLPVTSPTWKTRRSLRVTRQSYRSPPTSWQVSRQASTCQPSTRGAGASIPRWIWAAVASSCASRSRACSATSRRALLIFTAAMLASSVSTSSCCGVKADGEVLAVHVDQPQDLAVVEERHGHGGVHRLPHDAVLGAEARVVQGVRREHRGALLEDPARRSSGRARAAGPAARRDGARRPGAAPPRPRHAASARAACRARRGRRPPGSRRTSPGAAAA